MKNRYALPLLAGAMALLVLPSTAQVSGVSYTLTPGADWIRFHDDAGFNNAFSYGGKLGFGFGEFVEVSGVYDFTQNAETDFSRFSQFDEITNSFFDDLVPRTVNIHRFGGDLKVNLGRGDLFPFLSIGTGVMQFRPDGLQNSETIYLNGGIGVQYRLQDRYTVTVRASSLAYRYNPSASLLSVGDLTQLALSPADFEQIGVANFAIGAGVQWYLGGRARGQESELDRAFREQFSRGFLGLAVQVEPTYASVSFADGLDYRADQRFAGASIGLDFGPQIGLRGFYWRGIDEGSNTSFDALQAYGAEMKLNFGSSGSLAPYLTLGGGYMDAMDAYLGANGATPDDRPFAMGGVGVQIPVGTAIKLHGGVRSLLMSTGGADNLSDPSGVKTSWMYSGGISFGMGRRAGSASQMVENERASSRQREGEMTQGMTRNQLDLNAALARIDSLSVQLAQQRTALAASENARRMGIATPTLADSTLRRLGAARPSTEPATVAKPAEDRWVTLPIPQEGELYIRFGKPGGVSMETYGGEDAIMWLDPTTGRVVPVQTQTPAASGTVSGIDPSRSAIPATNPVANPASVPALNLAPGETLTAEQVQQIVANALADKPAGSVSEAATMDRLEQWLDERLSAIDARYRADSVAAAQRTTQPVVETRTVQSSQSGKLRILGFDPLTGYNLTSPKTVLLGVRGEARRDGSMFRMIPEFVMGFGSQTTWNLNANIALNLSPGPLKRIGLYAGTGLGFLYNGSSEVVLNALIGTEQTFGPGTFLAEFMTQDFGTNQRILVGYKVKF